MGQLFTVHIMVVCKLTLGSLRARAVGAAVLGAVFVIKSVWLARSQPVVPGATLMAIYRKKRCLLKTIRYLCNIRGKNNQACGRTTRTNLCNYKIILVNKARIATSNGLLADDHSRSCDSIKLNNIYAVVVYCLLFYSINFYVCCGMIMNVQFIAVQRSVAA